MRGSTVLVSLLVLAGLALPAASGLTVANPEPQILRLPLDGLLPTEPAHAPVPETNVGIGPGAHLFISIPNEGEYACTANFVWSSGGKLYLGAAGHCFLPQGTTATHGPGANYDASGVRVKVCVYGCSFGGQSGFFLVGNMLDLGQVAFARQTQGGAAIGNDFGVVEIPAALHAQVRETLPFWGGPTTTTPARANGPVCVYGNGVLAAETFLTMGRVGWGAGQNDGAGSWTAVVPINSGDSGGPLVTCDTETNGGFHGKAPVGIVTHGLAVPGAGIGIPGYGTGTTIAKAKQMGTQAGLNLELVI